jgi:hypothetical protein
LPSRFVLPPVEFRRLYGPNIRQTLLENYFGVTGKPNRPSVKPKPKKIVRQKLISDYFVWFNVRFIYVFDMLSIWILLCCIICCLACNKNINKRICKHSLMIYFRLFGFDRVFGGKTNYFETGVSYSPCR